MRELRLQVRNLYGPLLACVTASKSAFDAMCRQHSPDSTPKTFVEAIRSNPGGREGQIYRYAFHLPHHLPLLALNTYLQAHIFGSRSYPLL